MENTVIEYIKNLLPVIIRNDYKLRTIKLDKVDVINPKINDLGKLQRLGESYLKELVFSFSTYDENGELEIQFSDSIKIPVLINNAFLVNGSIRVNELALVKDYSVRVYDNHISINYTFNIGFIKEKDGTIIGGVVRYGKGDEVLEFPIDELPNHEGEIVFTDKEATKIQIKFDLDEKPKYLTKDLFWIMAKYGSDVSRDNIIDKRLSSTQEDLRLYLVNNSIRNDVLSKMTRTFYSTGSFRLTTLQSKIDYYFQGGKSSRVRYIPQTNPLALDSMVGKIKIPGNVAYNSTFMDLIDPINTPENNRVNEINELNVCVDISGGTIKMECIDIKSGKRIKLDYLEYLNSKVLVSDYYDYDNNNVIDSDSYEIKYHQKIMKVGKIPSDVKYVEPPEEDRLSRTTRQIPMINHSEPTRIRMSAGMSKQAVEVRSHEPRLISTGNEDVDYKGYSMTQFFLGTEGVVKSIIDRVITIEDKDGTSIEYTIPETIYGINGANTSYTTKLKVGDLLKPHDEVITSSIQKNRQYEFGVNAFVIYMIYYGFEYEDAFIVSESFSDKMTYYTLEDIVIDVKPADIIDYIIPVGTEVKSLDRLVGQLRELDEKRKLSYNKLTPSSIKKITHSRRDVITPNNYREGWVIDIKIKKSSKYNGVTSSTDEFINKYIGKELSAGETSPNIYHNSYPDDLPKEQLNSKIQDVSLLNEDDKYSITIRLIKKNKLVNGGKITNSWGSKGTVSLVLPDDKMPYVGTKGKSDYKPAEIIINPNSVTARMNYSQLYECLLTSCINKTYQKVVELLNDNKDEDALNLVLKYYAKTYKDLTADKLRDLISKKGVHALNLKVGSLSKLDYNKIKEWASEMNVSEVDWVTLPDAGRINTPQVCGYSYIMRLYHSGDASAKVTSAVRTSGAPLMGFGEYRDDGQRAGEMEYWALNGSDTYEIVTKNSRDYLLNQYVYINQLLLAGFALTDSFGNPLLSNKYKTSKSIADLLKDS